MIRGGSRWRAYAVLEGLSRAGSNVLQKMIGISGGTLAAACVATVAVGFVQMAAGYAGSRANRRSLAPDTKSVVLSIALGFLAGIFGTVLGFYTFSLGADIGARTLIIMSAIIPGAVFGRLLWNDPLGMRELFGIGVFLLAVWAMLDFPTSFALSSWVWLSFLIALSNAVSEVFARSSAYSLHLWVHNFWVGASTIFFSVLALGLIIAHGFDVPSLGVAFLVGSCGIGFLVVALVSFRLLGFQNGGTIASMRIVVQGVLLVSASLAGVWLYGEPVTAGKVIGVFLWMIAMTAIDAEARMRITSWFGMSPHR